MLTARPFEMASAPLGPMLFNVRLRKQYEGRCHRVLTPRLGAERILELLEGGVGGDGVGHVFCTLYLEEVAPEPANEG